MKEVIVKEGRTRKYHYQIQYITIIQLGLVMILLKRKMDTTSYWCLSAEGLWKLLRDITTVMSLVQSGEFNISKFLMMLSKKVCYIYSVVIKSYTYETK